jgi:hypothetical protein
MGSITENLSKRLNKALGKGEESASKNGKKGAEAVEAIAKTEKVVKKAKNRGKGITGTNKLEAADKVKKLNGIAKKNLKSARRAAVREAWKQERALVDETGVGTRPWTKVEAKELLENGKVKGYEGHHINNVNDHPQLAGNPDNIKFVHGRSEHLKEHDGNFKNKTSGKLIKRKSGGLSP